MPSNPDYFLFGWRVRSALPLGDLEAWRGDDRAPDLTITLGKVAERLTGARPMGPALQIGDDGRALLTIPAVARYLVEGDDRVVIDVNTDPSAPDVRVFLYGTVAAILCYRRGLLPLHATALLVDGRALLLCGVSGAGKSTLAATLARSGYPVLADDLCAVEFPAEGSPVLRRGFARLRLWRDAADHLEIAVDGLDRTRPQLEKYHVPVVATDDAQVPIGAIALLRPRTLPGFVETRALIGIERLAAQAEILYRLRLGILTGSEEGIFAAYTRLMAAVPLVEITRPADFSQLDDIARAALGMLRR